MCFPGASLLSFKQIKELKTILLSFCFRISILLSVLANYDIFYLEKKENTEVIKFNFKIKIFVQFL